MDASRSRKRRYLLKEIHQRALMDPPDPTITDPIAALQDAHSRAYARWRAAKDEVDELTVEGQWITTRSGQDVLHPVVELEDKYRENLAYLSARMVELGIEARRLDAQERLVEAYSSALSTVVDRLGLTAEQRRLLPDAIREGLPKVLIAEGFVANRPTLVPIGVPHGVSRR